MYTRLIKRPVAQIAQIDQLFQHFNLICAHGDPSIGYVVC